MRIFDHPATWMLASWRAHRGAARSDHRTARRPSWSEHQERAARARSARDGSAAIQCHGHVLSAARDYAAGAGRRPDHGHLQAGSIGDEDYSSLAKIANHVYNAPMTAYNAGGGRTS